MNRQRYQLALVLAAAFGLIAIHAYAPRSLYNFDGHAHILFIGVEVLLWMLVGTHSFLAAILWAQRRKWDPADAASFLFISMKALFWADLALTAIQRSGQSLVIVYLFFVIFLSTLNLDVQLFRRYLWTKADTATDERKGDVSGTAANARREERDSHS